MERDLRRYLVLARRWWWLLFLGAVIPMGISTYLSSRQPDLYEAKSTLVVGTSLFQNPDPEAGQLNLSSTLAEAYSELVRQGPILESVNERLGLGRHPDQLARQINTSVVWGAHLLEIRVVDYDPEIAAVIANGLADELIRRSPASGGTDPEQQEFIRSQLQDLQDKIEQTGAETEELSDSLVDLTSGSEIQNAQDRMRDLEQIRSVYQATYANLLASYREESPNTLSLFEPATAPQTPMPDKTLLITGVAGMAGLGLALAGMLLVELFDNSLRWDEDGAHSFIGLPILGTVPKASRQQRLPAKDPIDPVAQGVRAIQTNIFLLHPDRSFPTLMFTSASPGEGKSFVVANLAVVLAEAGYRVIAVDADMSRPELHEMFDLPNVSGLAEMLNEHHKEETASASIHLQDTGIENLRLLPAGRVTQDPTLLLTSPRFKDLMKKLKDQGDLIVIDSPPVLGRPDATLLATMTDATILVVSAEVTKPSLAQTAKERLLAQSGVNLLGLTVNRVKPKSYYYYARSRTEPTRAGADPESDGWMTVGAAAQYLGVRKAAVRRWYRSSKLATCREGLRTLVSRQDVEAMASGQLAGDADTETSAA
jgi:succinoglycan biosynthesis transport protein ExoP